jgi:hypothetical protein
MSLMRRCSAPGSAFAADTERALVEMGELLIVRVAVSIPGWVQRCVAQVLDAWLLAGGVLSPDSQRAVLMNAEAAGWKASQQVSTELRTLMEHDRDVDGTALLQVVERAMAYPTAVLRHVGIPAVDREQISKQRHPADVYDLAPTSLASLHPQLGELVVAWEASSTAFARRLQRDPP